MTATRSSEESLSPLSDTKNNKRTGERLPSPIPKRSKNGNKGGQTTPENGQKTIEETLKDDGKAEKPETQANGKDNKTETDQGDELKKREKAVKKREDAILHKENSSEEPSSMKTNEDDTKDNKGKTEKNAFDEIKADTDDAKHAAQEQQQEKAKTVNHPNGSIIADSKREANMPSSILEKGLIYFFFRGRVGTEHPQGIEDVARSYIVLCPLPLGAKIGSGPLEDTGNARLVALPKKMLPKSGKDRFLAFVEKAGVSVGDLRGQFGGSEYATKTSGTSHVPAATPFAEGIYAITTTGADSHLAYHLTVPSTIGEVQKELGLYEKGSFNLSLKNPEAPGPAYATIDNPAKYTKEIQEQFRGRRWMPVVPEALEFEGSQFLLIGEGRGELGKAVEGEKGEKGENEGPEEEIERLGEEDDERVKRLDEDDPVFADLGLSSKEYPHLQTTW